MASTLYVCLSMYVCMYVCVCMSVCMCVCLSLFSLCSIEYSNVHIYIRTCQFRIQQFSIWPVTIQANQQCKFEFEYLHIIMHGTYICVCVHTS